MKPIYRRKLDFGSEIQGQILMLDAEKNTINMFIFDIFMDMVSDNGVESLRNAYEYYQRMTLREED